MRKLFLVLLVVLFVKPSAKGQKLIKNYIQQKSIPISTISPDTTDFSDLEPIGKAIGDARIVMLGEQDHGDAPTFLAKTRLIEYLHKKKNFNVLAFESDFFGLNYGWDKTPKTTPAIDTFIRKNIFPIWTYCDACNTLFYKFVPSTWASKKPLIISGIDNQQFLDFSDKNLCTTLDSVFTKLGLPITKRSNYRQEVLPLIDSTMVWGIRFSADTVKLSQCLAYLRQADGQLKLRVDSNSYWIPVLQNLITMVRIIKQYTGTGRMNFGLRDIQMAKNLKWLTENRFKGQKIIVWAADMHVIKAPENLKRTIYDKMPAMGDYFINKLGFKEKVYNLGFTSATGVAGRLGQKKYDIYPPRQNSLENWINPAFAYAFVDFDAFNRTNPGYKKYFFSTAQGHLNLYGKWYKMYNGIFFIRRMYPCGGPELELHIHRK